MIIVRKITGVKNKLYARLVERKDKKMIKKVLRLEREVIEAILKAKKSIPFFVAFGLLSEEEGLRMNEFILKAAKVGGDRNTDEVFERVVRLSLQRITERVGGEVKEE